MSTFGYRLKEERERLGLSQTELAEKCGSTRKSQFNYESDARNPDSVYLKLLGDAGADVLYILTGQPSLAATFVRQHEVTVADFNKQQQVTVADFDKQLTTSQSLPPDEQLLLDAYRDMKAPDRKALLAEMLTGKKAKPAKEAGVSVKGNKNRTVGGDYYKK